MRKISTLSKFAMGALFISATFAASAQATDGGGLQAITEGEPIALQKDVVYSFTPSMTGTLTVKVDAAPYFVWTTNGSFIFNTEECLNNDLVQKSGYTVAANNSYTDYIFKPIEEGKTYYIKQSYYSDVNFTFTMSESSTTETLTQVSPTTSKVFNYVTQPDILLYASAGITSFGKATLSYGEESLEMDPIRFGVDINGPTSAEWLQIGGASFPNFKNYIKELASEGYKSFTVTVEDVEAGGNPVTQSDVDEPGVVVDNGTISVTYAIDVCPVYLPKESTWPSVFYSYWEPGDPAALIKMVFDMEIASVGETKVIMGQFVTGNEGGDPFDEYPLNEVTIEGNTVIIDLAGVERTGAKGTVTVSVGNVVAKNGMPAEMSDFENSTTLTFFKYIGYSENEAPSTDNTYLSQLASQLNYDMVLGDPMGALELSWPENVILVDADALEIPVYLGSTLVGNLSSTYVNLVPSGDSDPSIELLAETGDSGNLMYLLLGASGLIKEAGEYTVQLPEGIVENEAGSINRQQNLTIFVNGSVEGEVSPKSGTTFASDEDVVIVITYDGEVVEQNYSEDAPVVVTDYDEYTQEINWKEGVLYIEGNAVVINLGDELKAGTYYLSFREGMISVDGLNNEALNDYQFIVSEESGISSIEAINGVENIYNLNGVKVNKNAVNSGLYIINGKKVMIRK